MNTVAYLTAELPKYMNVQKRFSYAFLYNLVKLKRFAVLNIMAFSFQYLCIYHLQSFYPIYPVYPAIGITFTVVSILGENAIFGLLSGAVCAYYLKGFSVPSILLYSLADIVCAGFGAYACRNIFSSDIPRHATIALWMRFLLIVALVSSLSGFFRMIALVLNEVTLPSYLTLFYIYLDLCLADLNAIIIFYAFLSTWLSIYMSREKVSSKIISAYQISAFILFIAISIFMMKKIAFIYLLCFGLLATLYVAYMHGMVIATLLVYVVSMLYLSYFMGHQVYYIKKLGIGWYTMVPGVLFLFVMGVLWISNTIRHQQT
ncbi:MAG TPA: hypothetical protein VLG50_02095 [Candidatus Saccharimonadales bacterium]|nr:hypothetical protein [Candidatus Saccharimonadales bacterium]